MRVGFAVLICASCVAMACAQPLTPWRETLETAIKLSDAGSRQATEVFLKAAEQAREAGDGGIALAHVWNQLGVNHQHHGRHVAAEELFHKALSIYRNNSQSLPLDHAATLHNLAITARALARRQEAVSLHEEAIAIIERVGGPEHPTLVLALSFLGVVQAETGRLKDAEALLNRSLRIGRKALGPDHPNLAIALAGLSHVLRLRGEFPAARQSAVHAVRIMEKAHGPEDVRSGVALRELGQLEFEAGYLRNAAALWRRALGIIQNGRAPEHPDALNIMVQLGDIARLERRYREAEELLLHVVRAAQKPGSGAVLGLALHHLAILYAKRNQHSRAEPLLRRGLEIAVQEVGSETTEWAICASDLANTLLALKRPEEAEVMARKAVAVAEQANGLRHPFFLEVLKQHGQILRMLNRKQEAKQVAERVKILEASGIGNPSAFTVSVADLSAGR